MYKKAKSPISYVYILWYGPQPRVKKLAVDLRCRPRCRIDFSLSKNPKLFSSQSNLDRNERKYSTGSRHDVPKVVASLTPRRSRVGYLLHQHMASQSGRCPTG
jgi:hypothetical protein